MKNLYIVITQTGTLLSRVLRQVTGAPFNHVSLSLDASLEQMYSFGRKRPYNPVAGGFVREGIHCGTFRRFAGTNAVVLRLSIPEEAFEALGRQVALMYRRRQYHSYNYLGLALAFLGVDHCNGWDFYCSQFVREMLCRYCAGTEAELPVIAKPVDFLRLAEASTVYTGLLREYPRCLQAARRQAEHHIRPLAS